MYYFYEIYSWITSLGFFIIDIFPPLIRRGVFRLLLGQLGRGGIIDRKVYFRYPKKIFVGNQVYINRGCCLFASAHNDDDINIMIGDHVLIGPNTALFAAGHDAGTLMLDDTYGRITIENDVWIGGNVTILQGVTIHEGAVVGAGSVVVKDVPAYTINVGTPARVVKDRIINEKKDNCS